MDPERWLKFMLMVCSAAFWHTETLAHLKLDVLEQKKQLNNAGSFRGRENLRSTEGDLGPSDQGKPLKE